jgi:hypothetical protein
MPFPLAGESKHSLFRVPNCGGSAPSDGKGDDDDDDDDDDDEAADAFDDAEDGMEWDTQSSMLDSSVLDGEDPLTQSFAVDEGGLRLKGLVEITPAGLRNMQMQYVWPTTLSINLYRERGREWFC